MAKKKVMPPKLPVEADNKTVTIDIGLVKHLETKSALDTSEWNFVTIHRIDDPLFRWWGNVNSAIMNKLILSYDDKPREWKIKLFNMAQNQYDKYGTYYRVLDNSFGKAEDDDIYEVR